MQTVPSAPYAPPPVVFLNQYLLCPVYPSALLSAESECAPPPRGLDVLNAFPLGLISQFEPFPVSSLPLTPSALIEHGMFVWDFDAMQLHILHILLCFSPDTTNRFSAVLCGLYFACRGDRGPTLLELCSCFIPGSEISHRWSRVMHAAGALLAWCSSLQPPWN